MKKIILLIASIVLLLAFTGCKDVFSFYEAEGNDTVTETAIPDGYGAVKVSLVQGAARTAIPEPIDGYVDHYRYYFSSNGGTDYAQVSKSAYGAGEVFFLLPGTYNLKVEAFLPGNYLVAEGVADDTFTVSLGTVLSSAVTVTLRPYASGEGKMGHLDYSMQFPVGTTIESYTLTRMFDSVETYDLLTVEGVSLSNINIYGLLDNIPVGYYELEVLLSKAGTAFTGRSEVVHIYHNLTTYMDIDEYTFTDMNFSTVTVTNTNDSGAGSLRQAIASAQAGMTIFVDDSLTGSIIELESPLIIGKNLTIMGNGITITRSASWTAVNIESQLLRTTAGNININRIHFTGGKSTGVYGGAINNQANLTLESCIFTDNDNSTIYQIGSTLTLKGCTFYQNLQRSIYLSTGTIYLTGNLFYESNSNELPVIYNIISGNVTSYGYNVVNAESGASNYSYQCGWEHISADVYDTDFYITSTLKPIVASAAIGIIDSLPAGYPTVDFFGNPITEPASAGAIQEAAVGYFIDAQVTTISGTALGSIDILTGGNSDGLYSGEVQLEAKSDTYDFSHWLIDGVDAGSDNPLTIEITGHTTVEAVFDIFKEGFEGGLSRWTFVNGDEYDDNWVVGTGTAYESTKSAYISDNGDEYEWYATTASIVHMYIDITLPNPALTYKLSFMWKCGGDPDKDYLTFNFKDVEYTPEAYTPVPAYPAVQGTNLSGESDWVIHEIILPANPFYNFSDDTKGRLIFSWHNDGAMESFFPPPPAIDDILLEVYWP